MKPLSLEWIQKAEADFASAQRESRVRTNPNPDAVCFFSQQCIEKYIKGCLTDRQIAFPRTHDLSVLLSLAVSLYPLWQPFRPDLELLTGYAVAFRYPGESATRDMAKEALRKTKTIRAVLRRDLGLEHRT